MSLKNGTVRDPDSDSRTVSSMDRIAELLRKHYETWSRLYVEQRVEMYISDD